MYPIVLSRNPPYSFLCVVVRSIDLPASSSSSNPSYWLHASCGDDNRVMQYLIPCSCAQGAKQLTYYTLVVSQSVSQSPIDNRQSMMCPFLSLTHSFCRCFSGVTVCTCCTGALTRVQYVRADKELEETESRWVFVRILKFIANAMIYP